MGHSLGEYGALVAAGVAVVRGRARGGQRPRARDGQPRRRRPGRDGRRDGAARRGRAGRRRDRRLRRAGERELHPPGRPRRRDRGGRPCRRRAPGSAATMRFRCRSATPSTPRSWRPAQRAAAGDARAARPARRRRSRSSRTSTASSTRPATDVEARMLELLARQVASPVQFVKGLRTLYDAGARVFVEVGPKRALQGFASDVLGDDRRAEPRLQPPEAWRHHVVQHRAVRPLRRRPRLGSRASRRRRGDAAAGRDREPAPRRQPSAPRRRAPRPHGRWPRRRDRTATSAACSPSSSSAVAS